VSGELRRLRLERRWRQRDLADQVEVLSRRVLGHILSASERTISRWESGQGGPPSLPAQRVLAAVFEVPTEALGFAPPDALAATTDTQPAATAATSPSPQAEDPGAALVSAADESAHFLAWAEASNTGDLTVEQMHADVRQIAHSYLKVPTLPLFARARAVRDHAFALLPGPQRPYQTRDLYAAAGWALTLLAWMSTDLGRPDAADTHARAAWLCAGNAEHNGLRAWVRATQHTAARWEHRFLDAARYAEDGLNYAVTGSAELFLASAQALDLANAGQADYARAALAHAREMAETVEQTDDELAGPFTCSVDRAKGGFWSDVHLALGESADALAEANRAVAAFERAAPPRRNLGSERMARLQQVRAHLALRQFDGAEAALMTVLLDTAPEHRVRPLLQRLGEVHTQLLTCDQHSEPILCTMREAITDFQREGHHCQAHDLKATRIE
jgi:transcriptional regulator with XRE-family HTH domain